MADDRTLESYRSTKESYRSTNDPYRRASEPAGPNAQAGGDDPLAELARLIGRSDPFAEFGRSSSRQAGRPAAGHAQAAPAAPAEQWHAPREHEQQLASDDAPEREPYGADDRDYAQAPVQASEEGAVDERVYDEVPLAADHQGRYEDDHPQEGEHYADQSQGDYDAEQYYQDDAPLAPHEDEMYDDPPRAGRRGLAAVVAVAGCALLGMVGAYAYWSYDAPADSNQPPPVITADNSTPTKIVPAPAGDPQPGTAAQDRLANAGKEQLVSKQEEPVALKELAPQPAPRVNPTTPTPAAPAQAGSTQPPLGAGSAPASTEPKKIRTVTIRPDGTEVGARPVGAPGPAVQGSAPPAPRAGARNGGPISLESQAGEPAAAGRAQTAAVSQPSARPAAPATGSGTGGYVVQLASQRSESEALASFRSLQAKFPNELGDRQPIIRRADLGSKGVFYRTMVGPFASAHEASQFCASYKAAGGQCVVPNN